MDYIRWFSQFQEDDAALVGGKNASLGRMMTALNQQGICIPDGFAVTIDAYWQLLKEHGLVDEIRHLLSKIDTQDIAAMQEYAVQVREAILKATLPSEVSDQVLTAYHDLSRRYGSNDISVAVRSSATAEDLPTASFAGQQETFLHIQGDHSLLKAVQACMASLFTDRAIIYRIEQGFDHMRVGLSVGVQKMVNADNGAAGVAFSLDTETGFADVVMINGTWGLGETLVKGAVTPDEFMVCTSTLKKGYEPIIKKQLGQKKIKLVFDTQLQKTVQVPVVAQKQDQFCLTDTQILALARSVCTIEEYYSKQADRWLPQDVEWAIDGDDHRLYIVQARPETVHASQKQTTVVASYHLLKDSAHATVLTQGLSIGQQISSGKARVITSLADIAQVQQGDVIVTDMTDPDWVPVMKKSAGIITNRGGRTCHAAIVSRELGIPAIVGTGDATDVINNAQEITLDCAHGHTGLVYAGALPFERRTVDVANLPEAPVKLLLNIADPGRAFLLSRLPVHGVGLARLEFILSNNIGVHPMAIVAPDKVTDETVKKEIMQKIAPYKDARTFFVDTLAQGIGMIAAAFYPHEVIVRMSDFKTNEYRNLLGGTYFEPQEENPMLGWRGASRYCHDAFKEAFALECAAFKKVRETMGFFNVTSMVPFVRTVGEAKQVLDFMAAQGLERGQEGLKVIMMCEVPSNVLLIDVFSKLFDGFSIGSNDLTQLVLGVDRDSALLASLFDEQDEAVKLMLKMAINGAHEYKRPIGICGQAPSDFPAMTRFLIDAGIDSISLNADAVIPFLQGLKV